jgi:hypothetical protein
MKRMNGRTYAEQIQYHLDDGRAPNFEIGQRDRVLKARELVRNAIGGWTDQKIIELGCGAADISGPFSEEGHTVTGFDVVPEAYRVCAERWPKMWFHLGPIEDVVPVSCDVLILCETLEHLYDPIGLVAGWGPLAEWMLVSHPLDEWPPIEPGHIWSYERADFENWFRIAGMKMVEAYTFEMGPFKNMAIGLGRRL